MRNFEEAGLPALYYAADAVSAKNQKTYLRLFLTILALTVAAPLAIIVGAAVPCASQPMRYLAALSLVASMIITARIKDSQKERAWYGARAVAESVKTSAWRFAMCAEPFPSSQLPNDVESAFLKKLVDILGDKRSLNFSAAGEINSRDQITSEMRQLRGAGWQMRRDVYLSQRIQNQRSWYAKNAQSSDRKESTYFTAILLLQLVAVIVAIAFAAWPKLHINVVPAFTTVTATLLAWLQVKRYQETSQSYAVTAHELGIIAAGAASIASDEGLSKFVADAENAMSREHTLWVARRDAK